MRRREKEGERKQRWEKNGGMGEGRKEKGDASGGSRGEGSPEDASGRHFSSSAWGVVEAQQTGVQGPSHTLPLLIVSDFISLRDSEIGESKSCIMHFSIHDRIAAEGLEILFIIFTTIPQGRKRKLNK